MKLVYMNLKSYEVILIKRFAKEAIILDYLFGLVV